MDYCHFTSSRAARQRVPGACGCAIVFLCLLTGCGSKGYQTVPVSGRVTLDERPLADVGVMFVPLAADRDTPNVGPGSLGRTDTDGRFVLQTVRGENGAVPTEHVVRMSMASNGGDLESPEGLVPEGTPDSRQAARKVTLPLRAIDGSLRFNVPPEGTDQANFDLRSQESAQAHPQ